MTGLSEDHVSFGNTHEKYRWAKSRCTIQRKESLDAVDGVRCAEEASVGGRLGEADDGGGEGHGERDCEGVGDGEGEAGAWIRIVGAGVDVS
jgi:hypothetical protein